MREVVLALLCSHNVLGVRERGALAQTCRAAHHCFAPSLATLQSVVAACKHVLRQLALLVPVMMRTAPRMVPTYDPAFWRPLHVGHTALSPVELALLYAVVMQRFPVRGGRLTNLESAWSCRADAATMLIKHVPEEDGSVHFAAFNQDDMTVTVFRHLLTHKVRVVLHPDFSSRGLDPKAVLKEAVFEAALNALLQHNTQLLDAPATQVCDMLMMIVLKVPQLNNKLISG
jgi:hypothetical protein